MVIQMIKTETKNYTYASKEILYTNIKKWEWKKIISGSGFRCVLVLEIEKKRKPCK